MKVHVIVAPPIGGMPGQFEVRELCERLSLSEANGASPFFEFALLLT